MLIHVFGTWFSLTCCSFPFSAQGNPANCVLEGMSTPSEENFYVAEPFRFHFEIAWEVANKGTRKKKANNVL